jgi:hypothetical protein
MLIYVDDIIVTSSTPEAVTALLQDLKKEFVLFSWDRGDKGDPWNLALGK